MFKTTQKKNYPINKTDVYYIDKKWRLDNFDLNNYGPENNRGYRYILVLIDNFSKFGCKIPLRNINAQTLKDSLENTILSSKRSPNSIETYTGEEFYNSVFQYFLNNNRINCYSRYTHLGVVFAERSNRTIADRLRRPFCEKGHGNWIHVLPTTTKHYNKRKHSTTKLTRIKASLKKIEEFVYHNFLDKQKKIKPSSKIHELIRTAELERTFSKGDTTNWSYKLYKVTESINDTIPS